MTDTHLGEIVVVGQRRAPGGSFPTRGGGGGGGGGPVTPSDEAETAGDGSPPDENHGDPCTEPRLAEEWNADAAAAEAAKEFARRAAAQGEDLNTREWGAYLYRNADGSVRVGPINSGPEFRFGGNGTVPLIEGGAPSDIIGSVHSHNSGGHRPSSGNDNAPGDIQHLDGMIAYSGNAAARLYIVAPNQGPADYEPYNQINVYNQSNSRSGQDGPEVNPEAVSCPAS